MTSSRHAGHQRSARTGRRGLVALGAALTLLPLGAGTAAAQTYADPADLCVGEPPAAQFADRDQILAVHLAAVDCAVFEDIVMGMSQDGQTVYRPGSSVPRDQMATMIVATLRAGGHDLPEPSDQGFSDIAGNTHEDSINVLAAIGGVNGTTASTYSPERMVPRDQMATFLVQAAEFAFGGDQLDGNAAELAGGDETSGFSDVDPAGTHAANIAAAARLIGVTTGRTETSYAPNELTRRDQMASFVVRLLDVTALPDSTLGDAS